MAERKISERKVIVFTAGLVVFSGIMRFVSHSLGLVFFYIAFVPFLSYRVITIAKNWKQERTTLENYRNIVFIVMVLSILMNLFGWQEADFFLLFLLMVDYLLVINKRF